MSREVFNGEVEWNKVDAYLDFIDRARVRTRDYHFDREQIEADERQQMIEAGYDQEQIDQYQVTPEAFQARVMQVVAKMVSTPIFMPPEDNTMRVIPPFAIRELRIVVNDEPSNIITLDGSPAALPASPNGPS